TNLLIRRANFGRLVREICNEINALNYKWQPRALEALQEASEYKLVQLFENSYLVTIHAGRVTLFARDIQLALRLISA
ncbi:hypothetical protein, partial [Salmonella sp. s51228]|uniref:hypothetical protein n=1 Tax=Salmonella sp. s51228 TaxID=3159652 RepID=UPI00398101CB